MAPVNPHFKGKPSFKGKNRKKSYADTDSAGSTGKKKTWNPGKKFFQGSLQEGKTAVCVCGSLNVFYSFSFFSF